MTPAAFVFSHRYEADIGPHVFPTWKYRRTLERLREAGIPADAVDEPTPYDPSILELVHTPEYLRAFRELRDVPATRSSELPLTREIADWFELAVYGTVRATEHAYEHGACMHIGGGFHHAFAGHAEGFCYLNDVAVAARVALGDALEPRVRPIPPQGSVTVVDLDVHQGNGTARIFQGDDRVFTFSMHQEDNYPIKEKGDLDDGLPDGMADGPYLERLDRGLAVAVLERKPELVYYVAGADPYRHDVLGGLALTMEGLLERDRRVLAACREVGAPVVIALAGGYAADREDTARIHAATGLAMWETLAT